MDKAIRVDLEVGRQWHALAVTRGESVREITTKALSGLLGNPRMLSLFLDQEHAGSEEMLPDRVKEMA